MTIDFGEVLASIFKEAPMIGLMAWLLIMERRRTNQLLDRVLQLAEKNSDANDAVRLALLGLRSSAPAPPRRRLSSADLSEEDDDG